MLAERLNEIKESPTLAITAKVNAMMKQGIDVVGFGAGQPDFPTPQPIVEAAVAALREGFTKYTASSGIPELKKAIVEKLQRENNLSYEPSQIIVSAGAKHSLYNALMATCNPGDEVIIQLPYWVSYPYMILLTGARPVIVPTREENGFRMTPNELLAAITPKTRAIIINSPNNPTGTVYSPDDLRAIGKICAERNIIVISDEIYEKLVYEGSFISFAALDPSFKDITITVNGVSKAYSMTGWRMGYTAAPHKIINGMSRIQDHSTSCITSFVQKACITALNLDNAVIDEMKVEFDKRRVRMVEMLNAIPGISCNTPTGAFYAFANVNRLIGKKLNGKVITDSSAFASIVLDDAKVALVPGADFGVEGYVRLSYATSMHNIERGLKRIADLLQGGLE